MTILHFFIQFIVPVVKAAYRAPHHKPELVTWQITKNKDVKDPGHKDGVSAWITGKIKLYVISLDFGSVSLALLHMNSYPYTQNYYKEKSLILCFPYLDTCLFKVCVPVYQVIILAEYLEEEQ